MISIFFQLLFVTALTSVTGQRPQLRSQVPTNSLEPVGQWVWGKLINGFVYRAKSSYGGASVVEANFGSTPVGNKGRTGSNNFIPTVPIGRGPTTGEVLASDPRFSTLLIALGAAFGNETGLEAPFTVFAPTNKAFAKIDDETLAGLLEDPDALQEVLLRHIVAEKAVRIPAGDTSLSSVSGESINIQRDINDIFSETVRVSTSAGSARIVEFDILTRDGVIHAIDTVI